MQGILFATAIAMVVALVGTSWLIGIFRARGVGQLIREDGPAAHFVKHGTPTMGGLILLLAATLGYLGAHLRLVDFRVQFIPMTAPGLLTLATAWALGVLGAIDDLTGIRNRRSLGLNKRAKLLGQLVIGSLLAYSAVRWVGIEPEITWTGFKVFLIPALPQVLFAAWVVLVIAGTSNAVNLTDGLDGLASGSAAMGFFVFSILAFWQARHAKLYFGRSLLIDPGQLDLAIVAAALLGACIGFLWWNGPPARIFMGDTGSLALGGALAALSVFTRTQLLLLVIGGLFVIETLSVIIQVVSYRFFGGRRVFAMSPLHHHFELRGWAESTVIVRFWLISALLSGFGLALFYMEFLRRGGVE